jgi:hypothetical protein
MEKRIVYTEIVKKLIWILLILLPLKPAQAVDKDIGFGPSDPTRFREIGRAGTYDYEPSVIREANGETKVYVCGGGNGHDSIYLTVYDANGNKTIDSKLVLAPFTAGDGDDNHFACNPSVVKHGYAGLDNGNEKYVMYYECAPKVYLPDGSWVPTFTQTCAAFSDDGINWKKFNKDLWNREHRLVGVSEKLPATAVITLNKKMVDLFQITNVGGKYYQGVGGKTFDVNFYGAGHPAALIKDNKVWVYYYDSVGIWNEAGTRLAKSIDGFTFEPATKMNNNMRSGNPKYFDIPINGHAGVFISPQGGFSVTGYNYSYDGVNWAWTEGGTEEFYTKELRANWLLGMPAPGKCTAPGPVGIMSDPYGVVHSWDVEIYWNEGFMGKSDNCTSTNGCKCYSSAEDSGRGTTWQTYASKGRFFIEPKAPVSAYGKIEAEKFQVNYNSRVEGNYLAYLLEGSQAGYGRINFSNGAKNINMNVAGCNGGTVELRQDTWEGKLLATCTVPTGNCATWTTVTCSSLEATGIHDVFLVTRGNNGYVGNIDWFQFVGSSSTATPTKPIATATKANPTQVIMAGDANGDGKADLADFVVWKKEYLKLVSTKTADFSKNGVVGLEDFVTWKKGYLGIY